MTKYFIFLIIEEICKSSSFCVDGKNHCKSCNPITKLCVKCEKDIYIPDEKEGICKNAKKCIEGNNYCIECNDDKTLCQKCDISFYPDNNGGCSYTNNCEISYKGECLECKDNYILNKKNKICKSLYLEEYKNCEIINNETLQCEECIEGYFLNIGDKKCITTENCYKSTFGICLKCNNGYYLNKKENKCKEKKDNLKIAKSLLMKKNVIYVMIIIILMKKENA